MENTKEVEILLDTASFNLLLAQNNRVASAILWHYASLECRNSPFKFLRTPLPTSVDLLKKVPECSYKLTTDGWINIAISNRRTISDYKMDYILLTAQKIFDHQEITKQELDKVLSVYIQATLSSKNRWWDRDTANIFITTDEILLKNRLLFETHVRHGTLLNIMSPDEASIFLDIFLKTKGQYYASWHLPLNKGYWYWLSMRLKLPHYNVGNQYIDAIAERFKFILMALDEMCEQFYLGTNNDTRANTIYHFNYSVILIKGIFDNLAMKTNEKLELNYDYRKVNLKDYNGNKFLSELEKKNETLKKHIDEFMPFIKLVHEIRNLVVHHQSLSDSVFEYRSNVTWYANFVEANPKIQKCLEYCTDVQSAFDPFTELGFFHNGETFIEPYHFVLAAEEKLAVFIDKYLEILGAQSFIESAREGNDEFADTLNKFIEGHLGV